MSERLGSPRGPAIGRRQFLEVTAAGVSAVALGSATGLWPGRAGRGGRHGALGQPARHDRGARRLSLLGGEEVRLFRRHRDRRSSPGRSEATATVKLVDQNQADMGYPSPGVFSLGLEQGIPLASVFHMGGVDVFDFAFRKGETPADVKGIEGKTIVLGSAGWQSIADPMLPSRRGAGQRRSTSRPATLWGQALMQGQGDAALSWEGLRAQWKGQGLDFDYILGRNFSKLPANSFVIRKRGLRRPGQEGALRRATCAAGRWASSSAT